jgi:glycosyltransferase involved in cell wall biosynthesis
VTVAFVGPGDPMEFPEGGGVIDAGMVSQDDKADWLAAADVLCLPSVGEIFPVSILEAWSARTPTVATDIPPLRELLVGTGGGWVVDRDPDLLADRLIEVLADPAAVNAAGERGFARWRDHGTPTHVAGWHETLYAEVGAEALVGGT